MSDRRQEELIKVIKMYTNLLHLNRLTFHKPTIHKQDLNRPTIHDNLDAFIKLQMQLFKNMKK